MAWFPYSLSEMSTLVLQRADMVSSDLIGSTELNQYISDSIASLSDLLISTQGASQWTQREDLSFTASTTENGVVIRTSFYKVLGVGLKWPRTGTTERILWLDPHPGAVDRELLRQDWASVRPRYHITRNPSSTDTATTPPTASRDFYLCLYPLPSATWSVRIEFFPLFRFTTAGEIINLPFPDFIILDAAIKCATKEQNAELVALLTGEREEIKGRIRNWATPLDRGQPGFLQDVRGELDLEPGDNWGWR